MNDRYTKGKRNSHRGLSNIPLRIFQYLVYNNDSIFKLLTFDNVEIIPHEDSDSDKYYEMDIIGDNLTTQQKLDLLLKDDTEDASKYRIQLQQMSDDGIDTRQCRLYIYLDEVFPMDNIDIAIINFDVVCNNKYNIINNGYTTRIDSICEELLNTLDGLQLEGCVGDIFFDYSKSKGSNKINQDLTNNKNSFGKTIRLSVMLSLMEDKTLR